MFEHTLLWAREARERGTLGTQDQVTQDFARGPESLLLATTTTSDTSQQQTNTQGPSLLRARLERKNKPIALGDLLHRFLGALLEKQKAARE